jgi:predicted O-methyltransferase YrrM
MKSNSQPTSFVELKHKVYEIYKLREQNFLQIHEKAPSGIWEVHEDFLLSMVNLFSKRNVKSIETGCGLSTAVIANLGWKHTCIAPDKMEFTRLKRWLKKSKISTRRIKFIESESYKIVPSIKGEFDFILIDGNHGFPHPVVDTFYLSLKLRVGGFLAIDDTNLPFMNTLIESLNQKKYWEVYATGGKWVVYQLIGPNTSAVDDWI